MLKANTTNLVPNLSFPFPFQYAKLQHSRPFCKIGGEFNIQPRAVGED